MGSSIIFPFNEVDLNLKPKDADDFVIQFKSKKDLDNFKVTQGSPLEIELVFTRKTPVFLIMGIIFPLLLTISPVFFPGMNGVARIFAYLSAIGIILGVPSPQNVMFLYPIRAILLLASFLIILIWEYIRFLQKFLT